MLFRENTSFPGRSTSRLCGESVGGDSCSVLLCALLVYSKASFSRKHCRSPYPEVLELCTFVFALKLSFQETGVVVEHCSLPSLYERAPKVRLRKEGGRCSCQFRDQAVVVLAIYFCGLLQLPTSPSLPTPSFSALLTTHCCHLANMLIRSGMSIIPHHVSVATRHSAHQDNPCNISSMPRPTIARLCFRTNNLMVIRAKKGCCEWKL